ncbi:MAG: dihydrolipoamide acetyltransferase family protein, partial [Acidimicrobiales bacterium]
ARAQATEAPPAPARNGTDASGDGSSRVLSPVVRRLLSEHHLDPAQIQGSGQGGRITRADVLALVDRTSGADATPPSPSSTSGQAPASGAGTAPADESPIQAGRVASGEGPAGGASAQPVGGDRRATGPVPPGVGAPAPGTAPAATAGDRDEVVPFSNIRRRTAEHMVRSKATSAHTLTAVEVDFEGVERTRKAAKAAFRAEEGVSLTYLPFIARAVADAMREFPHVNASVGDDALIVHRDLHLGIAVDLQEEGLIVPVIHGAGDKRLRALARESAELAGRARARKLTADDITGDTFTITNPGPFGTFMTVPIINQPQVAILSTDGVRRRPVVVTLPDGSEGIAIHSVGMLALSFDHRAVDGAYASRFLSKLREIIETRDWDQEL